MISFAIILTTINAITFVVGLVNLKNYETILNLPMCLSAVAFLYNFISYISFQKAERRHCNQEFPATLLVTNFIIFALHFLFGAISAIAHL